MSKFFPEHNLHGDVADRDADDRTCSACSGLISVGDPIVRFHGEWGEVFCRSCIERAVAEMREKPTPG
jgi:hypothetical protein